VPRLFSVNRPLVSSKRRRLPLRGMLGNGARIIVGAVAASEGSLVVETRGHHLTLAVDAASGITTVTEDRPVPTEPGVTVHITFGPLLPQYEGDADDADDGRLARMAIAIAHHGKGYHGPSSPWWYSPRDLHRLMHEVTPADTTVARLCRELGFALDDERVARQLERGGVAGVLERLRHASKPIDPKILGAIGPTLYDRSYASLTGTTRMHGADIPYVAEAWAHCQRPEKGGNGSAALQLLLNRTPSVATILAELRAGWVVAPGVRARP
jgi:hypothetical protein